MSACMTYSPDTGRRSLRQPQLPSLADLPSATSASPPGVQLDALTRGQLSRVRRADDKLRIPGASQLGEYLNRPALPES